MRVAIKQYPLPGHKDAKNAARAVLAAQRQGKFWEMDNILHKNYESLASDQIYKFAKLIGLNMSAFEKDFADPMIENEINAHMSEGRNIGVRGTPWFYLNGKIVPPGGGIGSKC